MVVFVERSLLLRHVESSDATLFNNPHLPGQIRCQDFLLRREAADDVGLRDFSEAAYRRSSGCLGQLLWVETPKIRLAIWLVPGGERSESGSRDA